MTLTKGCVSQQQPISKNESVIANLLLNFVLFIGEKLFPDAKLQQTVNSIETSLEDNLKQLEDLIKKLNQPDLSLEHAEENYKLLIGCLSYHLELEQQKPAVIGFFAKPSTLIKNLSQVVNAEKLDDGFKNACKQEYLDFAQIIETDTKEQGIPLAIIRNSPP